MFGFDWFFHSKFNLNQYFFGFFQMQINMSNFILKNKTKPMERSGLVWFFGFLNFCCTPTWHCHVTINSNKHNFSLNAKPTKC